MTDNTDDYQGYEVGPIRPPSEAASLMLRISRNCPWNKCTFCGLYRGEHFSIRPVAHLVRDIDTLKRHVEGIREALELPREMATRRMADLESAQPTERLAFHVAFNWVRGGMRSVFLQDANALVGKPTDLVAVLEYLRQTFPGIERVTCYGRAHSVARIDDDDMARLAVAGLNRVHIGMESGDDVVLAAVRKGVDQETQVTAGQKVKRAGIELSEYYMPGLGGRERIEENALQTAAAMNRIDPDFIRIRTLAVAPGTDLHEAMQTGEFTPPSDIEKATELLRFLEHLDGITSTVKSDHILNLFQEVDGQLPQDRERMIAPLERFLALEPDRQLLYLVGRRTGIFSQLADLDDPSLSVHAEQAVMAHRVTTENLEDWTAEMVQRFI